MDLYVDCVGGRYYSWANTDRAKTVFHEEVADKFRLTAEEKDIMKVPPIAAATARITLHAVGMSHMHRDGAQATARVAFCARALDCRESPTASGRPLPARSTAWRTTVRPLPSVQARSAPRAAALRVLGPTLGTSETAMVYASPARCRHDRDARRRDEKR